MFTVHPPRCFQYSLSIASCLRHLDENSAATSDLGSSVKGHGSAWLRGMCVSSLSIASCHPQAPKPYSDIAFLCIKLAMKLVCSVWCVCLLCTYLMLSMYDFYFISQ